MQPHLKFTMVSESAAIGFSGLWIKSVSTLELWLPWLLAMKPKSEPGLPIQSRNLKVTLKGNTTMFASTSASLSREREVAAHFSTSAIKSKINSYKLQDISNMLCAQQSLETGSFLPLSFCSTDQVGE